MDDRKKENAKQEREMDIKNRKYKFLKTSFLRTLRF